MLSPDSLLSLRELLRCRRELPAAEVSQLLHPLPAMLDRSDSGAAGALLNEVIIHFQQPPPGGIAAIARQPVTTWPAHELIIEGADAMDAGSTIVGGISLFSAPAPARLAAVMYELLGGRVRHDDLLKGKFSPLAALDENANLLLRRALGRRGFADCQSFWKEWTDLVTPGLEGPGAEPTAAAATWTIPDRWLAACQISTVMELAPLDRPLVPTWLVGRSSFRIGRSRRLSDLPTRSATEGSAGPPIKELSRVHVLGEWVGRTLGFRDGNGERPSANGSAWNEQTLSPDRVTPLAEAGMLILSPASCRYRLEVLPHASTRLMRTPLGNLAHWASPTAQEPLPPMPNYGAVAFRHPRGAMVVRQTVWVPAAIGAEVNSAGEFRWSDEEYPTLAFLHRHGSFWLVNTAAEDGELRVDGDALARREAAPLVSSQVIEIGRVSYRVTLQ